jgi:Uma2 family endonuclease
MEIFELQGAYMRKMSDEQFYSFCRDNPDLKIERNADRTIEIMAPTKRQTGKINFLIDLQLGKWYENVQQGEPHGADTGFALPNGAIRSPDAAWISDERINQKKGDDKEKFDEICPDFVIELKSQNDAMTILQEKMQEWMANGCRLAWLIDPVAEKVEIYREDGSKEEMKGFDQKLSGEDVLPGFELDLQQLRV